MNRVLTDAEIEELLRRPKALPKGWRSQLRLRQRGSDAQRRRQLVLKGDGDAFIIKCRQSILNLFDFSVIVVYVDKERSEYRLLRCNGMHPSRHTNRWEKQQGRSGHTFGPSCHIHRATQRYQEADMDIDGFAEPTSAYSDYEAALEHVVAICGCVDPEPPALSEPDMFGGGA